MPTTYVGVSNFSPSITIPVDGDNANANSVNVSAKAEIDTQIYLFQTYGQLMQSTCPIRARWASLISLDIEPIPFMAVTESGTWKTIFTTATATVSEADLEGGGTFVADTWYFVYAFSVGGVTNWQISPTLPDQFLLYKNGSFSHKYVCSFKTNGLSQILPFEKYGNYTNFEAGLPVGGGSATVTTALTTVSYCPPTINSSPRMIKLALDYTAPIVFSSQTVLAKSRSTAAGYEFRVRPFGTDTIFFDIATDTTRTVYYEVSDSGITANFKAVGYYD